MDAVFSRVPVSYQRAVFARSVASGFIYRFGVEAGYEDYRRYVEELASGERPPRVEPAPGFPPHGES